MNNRLVVSVTDAEKKGEVLPACPWHKVSCQELNTGTWTVSSFSSGRGFYCKNNLDECFTGVYFVRSIHAVPFIIRDFWDLKKNFYWLFHSFSVVVLFVFFVLFARSPHISIPFTERKRDCMYLWVEGEGVALVYSESTPKARTEKNGLREMRCESRSYLF